MIFKNLNIKHKKSKNKIKLKNIIIINTNNIFEILVLKIYNYLPNIGFGQWKTNTKFSTNFNIIKLRNY